MTTTIKAQHTPVKNRFKVLGVNDDRDFCECCGRVDLSKVVWIEDLETGNIQHFGVVCAGNPAKAFGLKSDIRSAVSGWKLCIQNRGIAAGKLYRAKGGKYVNAAEPYSIKPQDQNLYNICLKELAYEARNLAQMALEAAISKATGGVQ